MKPKALFYIKITRNYNFSFCLFFCFFLLGLFFSHFSTAVVVFYLSVLAGLPDKIWNAESASKNVRRVNLGTVGLIEFWIDLRGCHRSRQTAAWDLSNLCSGLIQLWACIQLKSSSVDQDYIVPHNTKLNYSPSCFLDQFLWSKGEVWIVSSHSCGRIWPS